MSDEKLSVYLCYLLRHRPETLSLSMDRHGWVPTAQLIRAINAQGRYTLSTDKLRAIAAADEKGRYRISEDGTRIKACQGHSIPWVEPELVYRDPPALLYHGTTARAHDLIRKSGAISRMERHAVHMQAEEARAWQSARRRKGQTPVVLVIDAARMAADGYRFGVSENDVWCTETVPVAYLLGARYTE